MSQKSSIYSFLYELAILLFILFILITPIHALNTKHFNVISTVSNNSVLINLDSNADVSVGQILPIYRYHEAWQKKLGGVKIVEIRDQIALASFNPQSIIWPMGRHGIIIKSFGGSVLVNMGSDLGLKSGDRLTIFEFDGRKVVGRLEITGVGKDRSFARVLYGPQADLVGLLASEYNVATQAVLFNIGILSWIESFLILLVITAHCVLFFRYNRSPLGLLIGQIKKILSKLPLDALHLTINLLLGVPFIWFTTNLIIYSTTYFTGSSWIIGLKPTIQLINAFWYMLYLVKNKHSPVLAFWSFLSYDEYRSEPEKTTVRHILIWIGSAIIVYVFAANLTGFLRGNTGAVSGILRSGNISAEGVFEVLRYSIWSIAILACLFAYLYSLISFLWGKHVRNLDFTVVGWLTNGFCYPLFGFMIWQMVPSLHGNDPVITSGVWFYFVLCLELFLNILYTWSTLSMGTMFGVMSDKGLKTDGFFSVVRHPSYTLESMMFIVLYSVGLSTSAQWFAVAMFMFIYFLRSEREDNFMNYSNPEYAKYKNQVPDKFIPGLYGNPGHEYYIHENSNKKSDPPWHADILKSEYFLTVITVLFFVVGVVWRYHHIFIAHPVNEYIYSDMQTYLNEARRLTFPDKNTVLDRRDTIYPPGSPVLFGLLLGQDLRWTRVGWAQLLFSTGIPVLIFLIGYSLYGTTVGSLTLIISSIYVPFIHYAGFLLSEIPYTFISLLSFLLLVLSLKSPKYTNVVIWAVLAGIIMGLAASMRNVIFIPGLFLVIFFIYLHIFLKHKNALPAMVWSVAGAFLVVLPITFWCTRLNGSSCVISSNGPQNMLMGHYGEVRKVNYYDEKLDFNYWFSNPVSLQKGYKDEVSFDFGPYDQDSNLTEVIKWIGGNPGEAIKLSFRHIGELFYGSIPWPISDTKFKGWIVMSEDVFRLLILFPVIIYLVMRTLHSNIRRQTGEFLADTMVFLPIAGLMVLVFLTTAEPRYRIPFDAFFIILAARAYTLGKTDKNGIYPE
jgi:protein-S-isoprenylcysteine O-methyltransferase Ste14